MAVGEAIGAPVDAMFGDWLHASTTPGFLVSSARVARLADDVTGRPRYASRVQVRNDEAATGAVFLGTDRQAWGERTDPVRVGPHSSVEVSMVTIEPPSQLWLHSYFSLNRAPIQLAHQDDVEAAVGESEVVRHRAHLTGDLPRRQVAREPHPAGQAEAALHGATDLRRHAQRLGRGVGNEDGLDAAAVAEPEPELDRAVARAPPIEDVRRGHGERRGETRAERGRQVRHALEVGHRAAVHPAVDLPGVERGGAELGQRRLQRRQLELREIDPLRRGHGGGHGGIVLPRAVL